MLPRGSLGLVPNGKRTITPVPAALLALVPKPEGKNETIKSYAADPIRDTVPLIQKLAGRQLWQGKKLAAALKGRTVEETVRNDWDFIFKHIQYAEDPSDSETVRSLRRLVHEGKGDCDCFTNALQNLLINQGITNAKLRVAKYDNLSGGGNGWQHIYIVLPKKSGGYITLDPVVHEFNREVPYSAKKDFNMKLESLDGFRGLGCGVNKNSTAVTNAPTSAPTQAAQSARKTNAYDELVPLAWIKRQNLIATEEYLSKSKIPYTKTTGSDKKVSIAVETPSGTKTLNTIITPKEADAFKQSFTQSLTQAAQSAAKKDYSGWLWGLGLSLVGIGLYTALSSSASKTSLRGAPKRAPHKSLKSLQL